MAAHGPALKRLRRASAVASELRPSDVELRCCLAEAAIEANDLRTAIAAIETCFELDEAGTTPGGRRAGLLVFRLEKRLKD